MTVAGGKWTTYRKMAEDAVDQAVELGGLDEQPCKTAHLPIHGAAECAEAAGDLAIYGSDAAEVQSVIQERKAYGEPLHDAFTTRAGAGS